MVNAGSPAFTVWGFKYATDEEDVWMVRFVLNWEQPPARPTTVSAAMSHLRETIRTRSPLNLRCKMPGQRKCRENNPGAEAGR
jgi:hypothetical protein